MPLMTNIKELHGTFHSIAITSITSKINYLLKGYITIYNIYIGWLVFKILFHFRKAFMHYSLGFSFFLSMAYRTSVVEQKKKKKIFVLNNFCTFFYSRCVICALSLNGINFSCEQAYASSYSVEFPKNPSFLNLGSNSIANDETSL